MQPYAKALTCRVFLVRQGGSHLPPSAASLAWQESPGVNCSKSNAFHFPLPSVATYIYIYIYSQLLYNPQSEKPIEESLFPSADLVLRQSNRSAISLKSDKRFLLGLPSLCLVYIWRQQFSANSYPLLLREDHLQGLLFTAAAICPTRQRRRVLRTCDL